MHDMEWLAGRSSNSRHENCAGEKKTFCDDAILALSFGLAPSGGIYMQFERGKLPETPNAPYQAACIKDERWRSADRDLNLGGQARG
jgi:hypothetical protein